MVTYLLCDRYNNVINENMNGMIHMLPHQMQQQQPQQQPPQATSTYYFGYNQSTSKRYDKDCSNNINDHYLKKESYNFLESPNLVKNQEMYKENKHNNFICRAPLLPSNYNIVNKPKIDYTQPKPNYNNYNNDNSTEFENIQYNGSIMNNRNIFEKNLGARSKLNRGDNMPLLQKTSIRLMPVKNHVGQEPYHPPQYEYTSMPQINQMYQQKPDNQTYIKPLSHMSSENEEKEFTSTGDMSSRFPTPSMSSLDDIDVKPMTGERNDGMTPQMYKDNRAQLHYNKQFQKYNADIPVNSLTMKYFEVSSTADSQETTANRCGESCNSFQYLKTGLYL